MTLAGNDPQHSALQVADHVIGNFRSGEIFLNNRVVNIFYKESQLSRVLYNESVPGRTPLAWLDKKGISALCGIKLFREPRMRSRKFQTL